ncbi:MAG: ABC transporter ATP-binding protein [Mesorhizobium sp.]|uniref:branched-chain amino acid ABC transporter ATP-binding protein n=1 Tax=Mesorhizobium sp. TaxID=1871066 RepID=UPI0011F70362|nr:ABC transporter ATP-binding protein [Mesorhizobium sp.]TIQ22029.1 MAG: ABC transporter ATP-binding protein [Mesorhizobium sp.]TIQ97921.1 MAG: ABC transporter ATP-binding protein [Mesorhizobium sp.]
MLEARQAETKAIAPKLSLSNVSSGYGPVAIIEALSLAIAPGQIFALMGKNGMGKTTVLKTILGFVALRSGDIRLDGASISGVSQASLIASGVSYAPQEQALFQDLSVRDNLRLALRSDRDFAQAVERVFGHFPFLGARLSQRAGTLSGGEQKMLILGRALMLRPKLLLIDEISEGLQPSVVERIAAALRDERRTNGTTILIVEQNLPFALGIADSWAVLKLGRIDDAGDVTAGTAARVLQHLKI